jgi:hypothetical protein
VPRQLALDDGDLGSDPSGRPFADWLLVEAASTAKKMSGNIRSWGYCGTLTLSFGGGASGSGCFADNKDKLFAVGQFNGILGISAGASGSMTGFISNSSTVKDLGGYGACITAGIPIPVASVGGAVCMGLNDDYQFGWTHSEFIAHRTNRDSVAWGVSGGPGVSVSTFEKSWTTVGEFWDYPWLVEKACGSVLRNPVKLFTKGDVIPVCANLNSLLPW